MPCRYASCENILPLGFTALCCKIALSPVLTERYTASRAAYAVGYESSQHFSRDYRRLFHCSPMEDKFGKHL